MVATMAAIPIAIIGAGGQARVVAAALVASRYRVAGLYDDDAERWGGSIDGHPIIGPVEELETKSHPAIVAIGDNRTRKLVSEQLDLEWFTVVHPFSWVAPGVELGRGTFVNAGVVVQPGASIGDHVILDTQTGIGHGGRVHDYAHVAVAYLGADSSVGEGALLGIGSLVFPRTEVGAWATVGAGAVVVRDVRPRATVIGNPAREIDAAVASG
jgi:sugar O-acyltransferase (sialic acid O-acetyltransferase NeuD family)